MDLRHIGAGGPRALLWALPALLACAPARSADAPAAKEAKPPVFAHAPAQWRDYLLKAKAAQSIQDPLQRCLAYPDLPGNEWPAGHAAAHCRNHYVPFIEYKEVAELVRRKDVRTLESKLSALLQQHFSDTGQSEAIHYVFESFVDETADADAISQQWLQQAPDSAYANLARGRYLRALAWKSRGGKWARETPREDMRKMSEYFGQAVPLLRKAIGIEPRLMPAYVSLLDIGMADSEPKLEKYAVEAGFAQDPACVDLLTKQLQSLEPRWGGSYTQMEAAIERVKPYVARRPHLAVDFAEPYNDMGHRFLADDVYSQAAASFEQGAKLGSSETALRKSAEVALVRKDAESDGWKALAYLIQADRFAPGSAWSEREFGRALMAGGDPLWAIPHLKRALELEPDSAYAQYYLAASYYNSAQLEMADRYYRMAMTNEGYAQDSALEAADMWLKAQKPDRAQPFLDKLAGAYPQDPFGRFLRMMQQVQTSKRYDEQALRSFVKETDPKADRRLPGAIAYANSLLAEMDRIRAGMNPAPVAKSKKK